MPRGNGIIVNSDPKGRRMSGYIAAASTHLYPGTIYEIDPTVALIGGLNTFKPFNGGSDGARPNGPYWVLDFDSKQGRTNVTPYLAGDLAEFYAPLNGDELNLRFYDQAGTSDSITAGNKLIVKNAVGQVFKTTGSPQQEPAMAMEAILFPVADQLLWCSWSGV